MFSAALTLPAFTATAHAAPRPEAEWRPGQRTTRIGASQVWSVRTMTERIADILDELGAAHAMPMASAFLVNTVGPWLKAQAGDQVRKDMLAAASDLAYLTGWMAMYEKAHGLGQKYYVRALGLAQEAGDQVTYCRTLRGMSLQASNLGHGHKALELADSAAEAAPSAGPRLLAFLRGQQAHAAAMVGDRRRAHARLREAEDALSRADEAGARRSAGTTGRPGCSTSHTCSTRNGTSRAASGSSSSRSGTSPRRSGRAGPTRTRCSRGGRSR